MENITVNSLEQVPAAVQWLVNKVGELENKLAAATPGKDPETPELLTRQQAADMLHITLATLHDYTTSGKVQGQRIGSRVLYRVEDVLAALKPIKSANSKKQGL